ncbi:MAG: HEAT repeat domain-containing protein [bacterium]|nr:HEAT repeat domain-containing protein [bacterium]
MLRSHLSLTTALLFSVILIFAASPAHADAAVDLAMQDLESSDPAVQMNACRTLGAAKAKAAVTPLVDLLDSTTDTRVAATAAAALGAIGEKGVATTALLKAAKDSESTAVQYAALLSLFSIADEHHEKNTLDIANAAADSPDPILSDLAATLQPLLQK